MNDNDLKDVAYWKPKGIVSFATAKKLKESGWQGNTKASYVSDGKSVDVVIMNQNVPYNGIDWSDQVKREYWDAPTLEELGTSAVEEVANRFIK